MTDLSVRPSRDGELRAYATAVGHAFGEPLAEDDFASSQRTWEPDRILCGHRRRHRRRRGASFSFQLTVPGGATVGAAGVTAVGTMPTHRRRGALRLVMRQLLEDAQRHSDPVAILWASEGSIYQRFGYGIGTLRGEFDILQSRAAFRSEIPVEGSTRLIEVAEAARLFPPVYDQSSPGGRASSHGRHLVGLGDLFRSRALAAARSQDLPGLRGRRPGRGLPDLPHQE